MQINAGGLFQLWLTIYWMTVPETEGFSTSHGARVYRKKVQICARRESGGLAPSMAWSPVLAEDSLRLSV
jgi:hypothetical protein